MLGAGVLVLAVFGRLRMCLLGTYIGLGPVLFGATGAGGGVGAGAGAGVGMRGPGLMPRGPGPRCCGR